MLVWVILQNYWKFGLILRKNLPFFLLLLINVAVNKKKDNRGGYDLTLEGYTRHCNESHETYCWYEIDWIIGIWKSNLEKAIFRKGQKTRNLLFRSLIEVKTARFKSDLKLRMRKPWFWEKHIIRFLWGLSPGATALILTCLRRRLITVKNKLVHIIIILDLRWVMSQQWACLSMDTSTDYQ